MAILDKETIAIPSCAVSAIREVYPESHPSSYTGFETANGDEFKQTHCVALE